jgi:hypothetical protein
MAAERVPRSASDYGTAGREFESLRARRPKPHKMRGFAEFGAAGWRHGVFRVKPRVKALHAGSGSASATSPQRQKHVNSWIGCLDEDRAARAQPRATRSGSRWCAKVRQAIENPCAGLAKEAVIPDSSRIPYAGLLRAIRTRRYWVWCGRWQD